MTTASLVSAVPIHESLLAGHEFDITTPGLKTDYRSAALPTVLPGPVNTCMRACMYICVRAQMCACLNVRVCMRATDGQTDERWVDLNVCMCVRACVRALASVRVTLCARKE